jgi:hypothetical protein
MLQPQQSHWILAVALALILSGLDSASPQTVSAPPEKLGQLQITVSKVEQYTMIGDRFDGGPIRYRPFGYIYLHFKNVGPLPVCVSLVPSVEEYKGSEPQYKQPLKTGFAYNPKIENLKPGRETSGYYDFQPSPQKRTYVLMLQQAGQTQKCGEGGKTESAATSEGPSARFPLSGNTKPH